MQDNMSVLCFGLDLLIGRKKKMNRRKKAAATSKVAPDPPFETVFRFIALGFWQKRKSLRGERKCVDPKIVARKVAWKEIIFWTLTF